MQSLKPSITALVLAAGNGSRFGGNKLRHEIKYTNEYGHITSKAMGLMSALNVQPYVDEVLSVVRPDDHLLKSLFNSHNIKTIDNPDYQAGLSASIKIGVKAAKSDNAIMVCLADMPFIQAQSYQMLSKLFLSQPDNITRLIYQKDNQKQAGHPVIFPASQKHALLQLQGDKGAQFLLTTLQITSAPSDDKGIIFDIDTQQDLITHKQ
ncbi:nucleotidyltransferase family protein [Pseudomonas sp. HK3]